MYFLVPNFIHMLLIARKPSTKKKIFFFSKLLATIVHGVERLNYKANKKQDQWPEYPVCHLLRHLLYIHNAL